MYKETAPGDFLKLTSEKYTLIYICIDYRKKNYYIKVSFTSNVSILFW